MIEKHIQYVIWEYNTISNDEIYRSERIEVVGDIIIIGGFIIIKDIFEKVIGVEKEVVFYISNEIVIEIVVDNNGKIILI